MNIYFQIRHLRMSTLEIPVDVGRAEEDVRHNEEPDEDMMI